MGPVRHPAGLRKPDEDYVGQSPREGGITLHYAQATFCGMLYVIKFPIVERSQDVNARGFDKKETPPQIGKYGTSTV
jgi:hypothetical protein